MKCQRLFPIGLLIVAAMLTPAFVGCGGTSKDDIRRMMASRSLDRGEPEEEEEEKTTSPPPAAPAAAPTTVPVTAQATPTPTPGAAGVGPSAGPSAGAAAAPAPLVPPAIAAEPAKPGGTRVVASDPVQRATLASRNLAAIGQAINAFLNDKKHYPRTATIDQFKTPLLSWRVQILPYLGEGELYRQFKQDEPWNSPANLALIDRIPAVFQSPERTDNKTSVMAFDHSSTILSQRRPVHITAVEDGESSTMILLEAPSNMAVEWTKPSDYKVNPTTPLADLGTERGGRIYVVWADGTTGSIPADASPQYIRAALTYEAGDPFKRYLIDQPIDPTQVSDAGTPVVADSGSGTPGVTSSVPVASGSVNRGPVLSGGGPSLATSYWDAAVAAKQQGLSSDAWQWLAGAVCAGAPASQWEADFKWIAGLRRPVLGLHIGVGAVGDVQREPRRRDRDDDRNDRRRVLNQTDIQRREKLLEASAPVGAPLVALLEEHAAQHAPGAINPGLYDPLKIARNPQDLPPISYLDPARSINELVREGATKGCDVVAAVNIEKRTDGNRYVTITLYDVFRKTRLATTGRVLAPEQRNDESFQRDKEYQESRWRLKDFLEDSLTPGAWPVAIQPKRAAARLAGLGKSRSPWPLTALIEMRYYRAKGLVDDAQLLRAMTDLLEDDATQLLLGSETKQRRVLREWLPSDDPAAVVAFAEERQRQREDDDD